MLFFYNIMRRWRRWFNSNFIIFLVFVGFVTTGCKTSKEDKQVSTVRVHVQTHEDPSGHYKKVPVYRDAPKYSFYIDPSPILTEIDLTEASLVEEESWNGFHLDLQFDHRGSLKLENITATHVGRRLVIFSQFNKTNRWLAAPLIHERISDGKLTFVPDATRSEAEAIVTGLQNVIKEKQKRNSWP